MFNNINNIIHNSKKIVLSTHEKPDADGLGSAIAFYYYLKSINKQVKIIQPSHFPKECKIIDPESIVETFSNENKKYIESSDLIILFDVGHIKRSKQISEIAINRNIDIISIDHHKNDNTDFFKEFYIDVEAPATGFLVWKYLKSLDLKPPWDLKISKALYAALMTDTGSFRYDNTTPIVHDMASELLSYGVKPYEIYVEFYEKRSLSQLRLFSYVLNNLKFALSNSVCYCILEKTVFDKTNSKVSDTDGFTEFLRTIDKVEISCMITEQEDNVFRVNFRSKGKFTINDIASKFGGGGHKFAAGCKISHSNVLEIEKKLLNLLEEKLG